MPDTTTYVPRIFDLLWELHKRAARRPPAAAKHLRLGDQKSLGSPSAGRSSVPSGASSCSQFSLGSAATGR